jgi:hypothetical protein
MTTTDTSASFDFGRVGTRTFGLLGRNFVPFAILSVIFAGLPYLLLLLAMPAMMLGGAGGSAATIAGLVIVLVYLLAALVLQAALTRASIDDLSGKPVAIGAAVSAGVAVLLPLIGLGFVVGGAVFVGAILFGVIVAVAGVGLGVVSMVLLTIGLVAFGIYLFLRWIVAAPVVVVERLGVFASLRRSVALTQNHRWAIFGLLLLYVVFLVVLQMIVALIVPGAGAALVGTATAPAPLFATVVLVVMQIVLSMVITVGIASIYFELRQLKDGVGISELAQVFA